MTSPPDKFFRDHLESFHKPAPPVAWEKIESGLAHRRLRRMWMKAAAGITLLLAVSIMLWPKHKTMPDVAIPATYENKITPPASSGAEAPIPVVDSNSVEKVIPRQKENTFKPKSNHNKQQDPVRFEMALQQTSTSVKAIIPQPLIVTEEVFTENPMSIETHQPVPSMSDPSVTLARPMLVYSAHDVQSRFLKKTPTEEATPEGKSPSGLKKVMDIAAGIKYDDGTYGDLRQKKNEILSLGFLDQKNEADKK